MGKFDELVVISNYSQEHKADYGSSWVIDFGSSFHDTPYRRSFTTYKGENFCVVKWKNYDKSKVVGAGDTKVVTNFGHNLILKNVHHILNLRMNLMLVGDLNDRGYESIFAKGVCEFSKGKLGVTRGERYCNFYRITFMSSKSSVTFTFDGFTMSVWRWHHGHKKVNNKGKINPLYGDFSGEKNHDVKDKVMQER